MMLVREALLNAYQLNGNSATITGIFVMKNDLAYIVGTEDGVENLREAIGVDVANLKKILLAKVPAYGGSQFSYRDEAEITGVLMKSSERQFPCIMAQVERLVIYKYGEPILAIP
jgi:hypothetical protein